MLLTCRCVMNLICFHWPMSPHHLDGTSRNRSCKEYFGLNIRTYLVNWLSLPSDFDWNYALLCYCYLDFWLHVIETVFSVFTMSSWTMLSPAFEQHVSGSSDWIILYPESVLCNCRKCLAILQWAVSCLALPM